METDGLDNHARDRFFVGHIDSEERHTCRKGRLGCRPRTRDDRRAFGCEPLHGAAVDAPGPTGHHIRPASPQLGAAR